MQDNTTTKKNTDWTKFRAFAMSKYPNMTSKQKAQLDEFIKRRSTEDLARNGVLDIKDVATTYPDIAAKLSQEGIKPQEKQTAEQQNKQAKKGDVAKSIGLLEEQLGRVEGRGLVGGGIASLLGNLTKGSIDTNAYAFNQTRNALIGPLARAISGEVGTLNEGDITRAEGLLPRLGEDPEVSKQKIENIRSILSGEEPKNVIKSRSLPEQVSNLFLGSAIKSARDVGTGIGLRQGGSQQSLDQTIAQAEQIQNQATKTQDPVQKKVLLDQSRSLIEEAQKAASGIQGQFSEDVQKPIVQRALETGSEVASVAELPALVKSISNLGKGGLKTLKGGGVAEAKAVRDKLAKDVTEKVSGDKLIKPLEKVVEDDPFAQRLIEKIVPSLKGKEFTAEELLRKIKVWGDAYSNAGALKDGTTARVYDVLSRTAKQELGDVAPKVLKAHVDYGAATGVANFIKRVRRTIPFGIAVGTGTAAGTAAINKFFPFTRRQ